ncbi:uncharacterized protein NH340_JMT05830 [Sarcoptes scabiei]|uniref:Nuclear receptor-binding factor 2 MIT domain-containing protein n=1 Tax=Sarcoptes scabiei TaxID=52283 RepID=A0A834R4U6_SARSC|nr:uncharacterized protein NH340_JMT05830 [Sarcoptes scabiei]
MESYLNLAHRSHRKAEHCCQTHQFEQAIFHYWKASEYLRNSIRTTSCDNSRESLIVQLDYCLEKLNVLRRRVESSDQNSRQSANHKSTERNIALKTNTLDENISKKIDDQSLSNKSKAKTIDFDPVSGIGMDQRLIVDETRMKILSDLISQQETLLKQNNPNETDRLMALIAQMKSEIKSIEIEWNRTQNEIEILRKQNQSLRQELGTVRNQLKHLSSQSKSSSATFPELPPLEPPKLLY